MNIHRMLRNRRAAPTVSSYMLWIDHFISNPLTFRAFSCNATAWWHVYKQCIHSASLMISAEREVIAKLYQRQDSMSWYTWYFHMSLSRGRSWVGEQCPGPSHCPRSGHAGRVGNRCTISSFLFAWVVGSGAGTGYSRSWDCDALLCYP
jgi:hypothetical protein